MTPAPDDLTRDLFHRCALRAYVEIARETGGWPDSEMTKRRACEFYERELRGVDVGSDSPTTGGPGSRSDGRIEP